MLIYGYWHTGINKVIFIYSCIIYTLAFIPFYLGDSSLFLLQRLTESSNTGNLKIRINIFRSVQVVDFVHYKPYKFYQIFENLSILLNLAYWGSTSATATKCHLMIQIVPSIFIRLFISNWNSPYKLSRCISHLGNFL